jgi:hypothetical protein
MGIIQGKPNEEISNNKQIPLSNTGFSTWDIKYYL